MRWILRLILLLELDSEVSRTKELQNIRMGPKKNLPRDYARISQIKISEWSGNLLKQSGSDKPVSAGSHADVYISDVPPV